jgi:hypothetical protein
VSVKINSGKSTLLTRDCSLTGRGELQSKSFIAASRAEHPLVLDLPYFFSLNVAIIRIQPIARKKTNNQVPGTEGIRRYRDQGHATSQQHFRPHAKSPETDSGLKL